MPHDEDEFEPELDDEGDEDDDGDDAPTAVFVGIPSGGNAEEVFRTISSVCDRLELEALRQTSRPDTEATHNLIDAADFAILDLSQKRPSIDFEVEQIEREFDPAFILLIAKTGTPPIPSLERQTIHNYADKGDLRALVERHLNTMVDMWHETEAEYDEDDDE